MRKFLVSEPLLFARFSPSNKYIVADEGEVGGERENFMGS